MTGGTYPNQVTLTGDMWPDWAAEGTYLRCAAADAAGGTDMVAYRVAERKSATILTLDPVINPGVDLPAGTEFVLYRDTYLLPEDYIAQDQALYERNFGGMDYCHPREWLYENRYVFAQGVPQRYTITGDGTTPAGSCSASSRGRMSSKTIDFIYKRRPRPAELVAASDGRVSMSAGRHQRSRGPARPSRRRWSAR